MAGETLTNIVPKLLEHLRRFRTTGKFKDKEMVMYGKAKSALEKWSGEGEKEVKATLGSFFEGKDPNAQLSLDELEQHLINATPEVKVTTYEQPTREYKLVIGAIRKAISAKYEELHRRRLYLSKSGRGETAEVFYDTDPEFRRLRDEYITLYTKYDDLIEGWGRQKPRHTNRVMGVEAALTEENYYTLPGSTWKGAHAIEGGNFGFSRSAPIETPMGKGHVVETMQSNAAQKGAAVGFTSPELKSVLKGLDDAFESALDQAHNTIERAQVLMDTSKKMASLVPSDSFYKSRFEEYYGTINELMPHIKSGYYSTAQFEESYTEPIRYLVRDLISEKGPGVDMPVFRESWSTFMFQQELYKAVKNDAKFIAFPDAETAMKIQNAPHRREFFVGLYEGKLPKDAGAFMQYLDPDVFFVKRELVPGSGEYLWVCPITPKIKEKMLVEKIPTSLKGIAFAAGSGSAGALTVSRVEAVSKPEEPDDTEEQGLIKRGFQAWINFKESANNYVKEYISGLGTPKERATDVLVAGFSAIDRIIAPIVKLSEERQEYYEKHPEEAHLALVPYPIDSAKAFSRGAGIALGTVNTPLAFVGGWLNGSAELRNMAANDVVVTDKKLSEMSFGERIAFETAYMLTSITDSLWSSIAVKGEWGDASGDRFKTVVGKDYQEYFGVIKGTIIEIALDLSMDPFNTAGIALHSAIRAGRAAVILKELLKNPRLVETHGVDKLKKISVEIGKLSKPKRLKFADDLLNAKDISDKNLRRIIERADRAVQNEIAKKAKKGIVSVLPEEGIAEDVTLFVGKKQLVDVKKLRAEVKPLERRRDRLEKGVKKIEASLSEVETELERSKLEDQLDDSYKRLDDLVDKIDDYYVRISGLQEEAGVTPQLRGRPPATQELLLAGNVNITDVSRKAFCEATSPYGDKVTNAYLLARIGMKGKAARVFPAVERKIPGHKAGVVDAIASEIGVDVVAFRNMKDRTRFINHYIEEMDIPYKIDVLKGERTFARQFRNPKTGVYEYSITLDKDATPIDVVHELAHIQDYISGYKGVEEDPFLHFSQYVDKFTIGGEHFAGMFVHRLALKDAVESGKTVDRRLLEIYKGENWARKYLGLPLTEVGEPFMPYSPKIFPGTRYMSEWETKQLYGLAEKYGAYKSSITYGEAEIKRRAKNVFDTLTQEGRIEDLWDVIQARRGHTDEILAAKMDLAARFTQLMTIPKGTRGPESKAYMNAMADINKRARWIGEQATESSQSLNALKIMISDTQRFADDFSLHINKKYVDQLEYLAATQDIAGFRELMENPDVFVNVPIEEATRYQDAFIQMYKNNMLFNLNVQTMNIVTNTIWGVGRNIGLHPLSAFTDWAWSGVTGKERQIYLAEWLPMVKAFWNSLPEGAKRWGTVIRKGTDYVPEKGIFANEWGIRRNAFKNSANPFMRAVGDSYLVDGALRAMLGADMFFKTTIAEAKLKGLAIRENIRLTKLAADNPGIKIRSVEDIMRNPSKSMLDEVIHYSAEAVFFDKPGKALRGAINLREAFGVFGHVFIPFMATTAKIVGLGLNITPGIGLIDIPIKSRQIEKRIERSNKKLQRLYDDMRVLSTSTLLDDDISLQIQRETIAKEIASELEQSCALLRSKSRVVPEAIANQLIGVTMAYPVYRMWEKGTIVGAPPPVGTPEWEQWKIEGKLPYSKEVGDKWIRFNDVLGPFAIPICIMVDMFDTAKSLGEAGASFETITSHMADHITKFTYAISQQMFIRTTTDLLGVMMRQLPRYETPEEAVGERAARILRSSLPVIGYALIQNGQEAYEAATRGKVTYKDTDSALDEVVAHLFPLGVFGIDAPPIKYDCRGRPAGRTERLAFTDRDSKVSAVLAQFFPFLSGSVETIDKIDQALIEAGYFPFGVDTTINGVDLTSDMIDDFNGLFNAEIEKNVGQLLQGSTYERQRMLIRQGDFKAQEELKEDLSKEWSRARRNAMNDFMRKPSVQQFLQANQRFQ